MLRFFQPTEAWLDWFSAYVQDGPVIECGCGDGHTAIQLIKRNVKILCCDPRYRHMDITEWPAELRSCLLPYYAEQVTAIRTTPATLLFCRPCHDGFVSETILGSNPESRAIYVSKPGNVHEDIEMYGLRAEELDAPPGLCERTFRVFRN